MNTDRPNSRRVRGQCVEGGAKNKAKGKSKRDPSTAPRARQTAAGKQKARGSAQDDGLEAWSGGAKSEERGAKREERGATRGGFRRWRWGRLGGRGVGYRGRGRFRGLRF